MRHQYRQKLKLIFLYNGLMVQVEKQFSMENNLNFNTQLFKEMY